MAHRGFLATKQLESAETPKIPKAGFIVIALILILIVYFDTLPPSSYSTSTITETTITISYPNSWSDVVNTISSCQSIVIESFNTGQNALMQRNDSLCGQVISYLQDSNVTKMTSKIAVVDGKTRTALAAYEHDLTLSFELGNGSSIKLDLVGNTIWYEDEFSVYKVSVNNSMYGLVKNFLLAHSNSPSQIVVSQHGVELLATLSSLNIRSGDDLTINATLENINDTNGITFSSMGDYIEVNVRDSHSLVYDTFAYFTYPYGSNGNNSILEPGQKTSSIIRWDTSQNVSNGNEPPSTGKYFIQISATFTDLGSGSSLTLETGYVDISLSSTG
ncbi:MAG: hypothetical protein ABSB40_11780 [Nitrososphaeria archaeon]|jgi:hypothetical protein